MSGALHWNDEAVELGDLVIEIEDSASEVLQGELGRDHRVSISDVRQAWRAAS